MANQQAACRAMKNKLRLREVSKSSKPRAELWGTGSGCCGCERLGVKKNRSAWMAATGPSDGLGCGCSSVVGQEEASSGLGDGYGVEWRARLRLSNIYHRKSRRRMLHVQAIPESFPSSLQRRIIPGPWVYGWQESSLGCSGLEDDGYGAKWRARLRLSSFVGWWKRIDERGSGGRKEHVITQKKAMGAAMTIVVDLNSVLS
jgi:hypothetical protein